MTNQHFCVRTNTICIILRCYLEAHECPCQMASHSSNGFSTARECDIHTDGQTIRGNICRNKPSRWCFQRRLIIIIIIIIITTNKNKVGRILTDVSRDSPSSVTIRLCSGVTFRSPLCCVLCFILHVTTVYLQAVFDRVKMFCNIFANVSA